MTAFVQSAGMQTKQVLVGPGDYVALDINGKHYPVRFITNGGDPKGSISEHEIMLENIGGALGGAIQFQVPASGVTKKLNIAVVDISQAGAAYRLITWSLY